MQYDTVSSEAEGLASRLRRRDARQWTWVVGSNTAAGRWPIFVTCVKDDRAGKLLTSILVK